jgi:hypothetical protein
MEFIHLIERTELVTRETCVTGLHSSERDTAWENDVEIERGV